MNRITRSSKWLHRWIGLLLIPFAIWMSLSGIVLNHPELIRNAATPRWLTPPQYRVRDWSRGALRTAVFSTRDPEVGYLAGTQGVWRTRDAGRTIEPLDAGFPAGPLARQTSSLILIEDDPPRLYAGTRDGLYVCDLSSERWRRIPLPVESHAHAHGESERVQKLLLVENRLLAFTRSHAYQAEFDPRAGAKDPAFERVALSPVPGELANVSFVRLFFDLHSGKIGGLAGRLLFDLVGVIIIFLALSAAYLWYLPGKLRGVKRAHPIPASPTLAALENSTTSPCATALEQRSFSTDHPAHSAAAHPADERRRGDHNHHGQPPSPKLYRSLFRYHLKLGIWTAALLLIVAGTGLFMRPPLLVALLGGHVSREHYVGPLAQNPWHERILNALHDPRTHTIVIDTTEGLWQGPDDFSQPFHHIESPAPIFVMGTTVFETDRAGDWIVGSFNGLFRVDRASGETFDLISQAPAGDVSPVRPAKFMVAGYFQTPTGQAYATGHYQGLRLLKQPKNTTDAPEAGSESTATASAAQRLAAHRPADAPPGEPRFAMPAAALRDDRLPLWNFLFELHNGRIFRDLLGPFYALVVPLGSLLFLLITLTGIYDWCATRNPQRARQHEIEIPQDQDAENDENRERPTDSVAEPA